MSAVSFMTVHVVFKDSRERNMSFGGIYPPCCQAEHIGMLDMNSMLQRRAQLDAPLPHKTHNSTISTICRDGSWAATAEIVCIKRLAYSQMKY